MTAMMQFPARPNARTKRRVSPSALFENRVCWVGGLTQPVGRRRQGHALGAHGQREDLADDDPGAGAPGGGEEEDVDADEGDHGLDGVVVVRADGADDGDDELADQHAEGAPDEQRPAAEALHGVERDGRRARVDERRDERDEEGVLDGAELLEEGGAEVEDKVDAGPGKPCR